jgi:hypothetical protein
MLELNSIQTQGLEQNFGGVQGYLCKNLGFSEKWKYFGMYKAVDLVQGFVDQSFKWCTVDRWAEVATGLPECGLASVSVAGVSPGEKVVGM